MATVGSLIFEMSANVARLQQDMDKAQSTVKSAMDSIGSAVNTAKAALAALGVAIGAHEFVSFIESGISSVAMLERLSLQTGITVETLSALRGVAAASGTGMDAVAGMVAKLEKNMLQFAQSGGGKAAEAFKALGMSQADVAAGLKDMDGFLPKFAEKLLQTGVGGETVGLAMELIGKGASAALPFLNELANAHELVATRTAEQAQRAHELEVEMSKVSERTLLTKEDFAMGLTPALMQTVDAFNELNTRGDGAVKLGETLGIVLRWAATAAGSFWLALKDMGDGIGAFMAQVNALAHGDLDAVRAIGEARDAQAEKNKESFESFQKSMLDAVAPAQQVADATERQALATGDIAEVEADYSKLFDQDAANRLKSIEAETAEYENQLRAIAKAQEVTKKSNDIARQLGLTFESAFENAVVRGENLSKVLQGIEQDIARIILRQTVTQPVAAAVSGTVNSFFGGGGGSGPEQLAGPRAAGGSVSAGMSYLVGERGPEVLTMGASSGYITPNGAGGHVYIDARGADTGAIARLEAGLRRLNASIEHRAVGAVQRAYNQRGVTTPMG
jgi:hypothetical protein